MPLENEDIEFESLLADKRHKELTASLKNILLGLEKGRNEGVVVEAIEKQTIAMEQFAAAIQSIPAPEIKVESNNGEMVSSLQTLAQYILKGQSEIMQQLEILNQKKEWEFEFKRSHGNIPYIESPIKAKQIK